MLLALLAATTSQAAATAAQGPPSEAMGTRALSDGIRTTSWADPRRAARILKGPSPGAGAVGRLHMLTEEGYPEVYLLLERATDPAGETWVRLRIPGRPNGRTGWVPRRALGDLHVTHWALRVNLSLLRATLYLAGRPLWRAPVGVGAPATPTPTGSFWIRERMRVPGNTIYGPFAFGTSAYSSLSEWPKGGVVGIHGTNEPGLVPGRPSHGCIRMRNTDILYLARRLPLGAPVQIVG